MTFFPAANLRKLLSSKEYNWGLILFYTFFLALVSSQTGMDFFSGVMFLTSIYWTIRHREESWTWPKLGLKWLWTVWLIVIGLGLLLNPVIGSPFDLFFEFRWMLEFYVFVLFFCVFGDDARTLRTFAIILSTAAVLAIIFYFVGYNFLTQDIAMRTENLARFSEYRAGGLFDHAMPLAHSYGPILLVFIGLVLANSKNVKKISPWIYLAIALTATTLVLTFTRGVWIGATCGLIAMSFFLSRKWGILSVAALASLLAISMAGSNKIHNRVMETLTMTNKGDHERITIWKANWLMVLDKPIIGLGYEQNKSRLREYYDKMGVDSGYFEGHAHNEYMHLLSGTGILGLLCYLVFLIYTFHASLIAFRTSSNLIDKGIALGLIGAMTCFHVGSFTESNFAIGKNRYMILFLMAWAIWLKNKAEKITSSAL